MKPESIELTPEEIYEFNLWLFDHPQYRLMSWCEQVTLWREMNRLEEAA